MSGPLTYLSIPQTLAPSHRAQVCIYRFITVTKRCVKAHEGAWRYRSDTKFAMIFVNQTPLLQNCEDCDRSQKRSHRASKTGSRTLITCRMRDEEVTMNIQTIPYHCLKPWPPFKLLATPVTLFGVALQHTGSSRILTYISKTECAYRSDHIRHPF